MLGGLPERECITKHLPIHGFRMDIDPYTDPMAPYGINKEDILVIGEEEENMAGFISAKLSILKSQVAWAVRKEMARTVEDVLARRTRALFLDARESIRIAPEVASIMAKELKQDEAWINSQVKAFELMAKNYYFEL
jgi:glycerol-3-phosphate dehydrogenase